MIIDCASCVGRPTECDDCVISVVLGPHPAGVDLDAAEQTAVAVLAGSGLVPPLRLMPLTVVPHVPDEAQEAPAAQASQEHAGTATRWSRRQRAG